MARTSLFWRLLGAFAVAVAAQAVTLAPSNGTLTPVSPANTIYLILYCENVPPVPIIALNSLSATITSNYNVDARDVLVHAQPTNSSFGQGDIAYVSCDSEDYSPGQISAAQYLDSVIDSNVGLIVMYSRYSKYCSVTSTPSSAIIFSVTGASYARSLLNVNGNVNILPGSALRNVTVPLCGSKGTIISSMFGGESTAVAMIVLYSITGVIACLFLLVIVSGAIRAHRHPEQYGPSQVLGRPRQSRAKGIARAMLDTIPIVKFGEHHNHNKDTDAELANIDTSSTPPPPPTTGDAAAPAATTPAVAESAAAETQEAAPETLATDAGAAIITSVPKEGHVHSTDDADADADNGLTCSICTEEFTQGEDIRLLPCNHKYHPACVDPWLLNVSGTCPLCRIDLRPPNSQAAEGEEAEGENVEPAADDTNNGAVTLNEPAATVTPSTERQPGRRGLRGLLDRARMQRASPEERIAALRRFREASRGSVSGPQSQEQSEGAPPATQRSRAWSRLSGLMPEDMRIHRSSR